MTNRPAPPPPSPVSGPRPARLRAHLRVALQTSAGLALLALWLHSVPIAQVWRNARPHHLWPLALIAFCTVASALLRAGRWKLLMRPVLDLPVSEMFWVNSAGNLVNYLLPLRAGDAIRFFWIGRRHPAPAGACLSSMMLDKAFDVAAMAAFLIPAAALELALHGPGDPLARVLEVAAAGPAVILVALVAGIRLGPRLAASGPARRIAGGRLAARAVQESRGFAAAGSVGGVKRGTALAVMTAAALLGDGAAFSLLFAALDIHLPFAAAMSGSVGITVSYGLPSAPGYVGNVEVAGSMVLATGLGLQRAVAAGAVLLWHALAAAMVVSLGLLGLSRLRVAPAPQPALLRGR